MRFVVRFEDNEDHADKRQQHMSEHLEFLARHAGAIQAAGPMFATDTASGAGGMWIVEAASSDRVRALVEEDPFYPTGLRKEIEILEWRLVFESGELLG